MGRFAQRRGWMSDVTFSAAGLRGRGRSWTSRAPAQGARAAQGDHECAGWLGDRRQSAGVGAGREDNPAALGEGDIRIEDEVIVTVDRAVVIEVAVVETEYAAGV